MAYITGLPVDGKSVIERLEVDIVQWCIDWLTAAPEVAPNQRYGWTISLPWLRGSMED